MKNEKPHGQMPFKGFQYRNKNSDGGLVNKQTVAMPDVYLRFQHGFIMMLIRFGGWKIDRKIAA
jgi:hypothetical protein